MKNTLSKLELSYIDEKNKVISYVVQYNPNSISIGKHIEWNSTDLKLQNIMEKQFENGHPKSISIKDIFFDTSTIGNMSVYTNFIEPLEAMAIVRSYKMSDGKIIKRPPYITLSWGKSPYFVECILTQIDYEFKMFTRDGTPIRARVDLSFEEIATATTKKAVIKKQKTAKTYRTKKGETLYEIAEKTYEKPDRWKIIATANGISNPFKVPAGITLYLPVIS